MDARRLGHRAALPHALLEVASPAYLTDTEWDALDEALAYTAAPCKGVPGPLTRIHPRPPSPKRTRLSAHDGDDHDNQAPGGGGREGPVYRLADYLDQYGHRHRADQFPPLGFWAAAAGHCHPGDQATLGDAARDRGLYRVGAKLHKCAAAHGDPAAMTRLIHTLHGVHPDDHRPANWIADHVPLDDLGAVADLLGSLPYVGADQQVTTLPPAIRTRVSRPRCTGRSTGGSSPRTTTPS
jgi:hypothetical protein